MRIIRYAAAAVIVLSGCNIPIVKDNPALAGKYDGHYVGYFAAKDCPVLTGQSTRIDAFIENERLIGKADGILFNIQVTHQGNFTGRAGIDKDDMSNAWIFDRDYFQFQGVVGDGVIQAKAGFGTEGKQTTCTKAGLVAVELKKQ